ncbi:unnamed protein product [Phaedon cochleariae]|uniref:Myb/SANT-like DNA-binding domain-containing protein n=1 Tax=Phaedon cochleariae TaxID=80249 RepID=A0A9N9X4G9_PHACE|nr:unnamed protein product [Phaedon cochleariae]
MTEDSEEQPPEDGLLSDYQPTASTASDDDDSQVIPANPFLTRVTNVWNFNDPRKRKHIFENVANDLISARYTVDPKHVQNKWKGLLRSYTKAKDIKNSTGQGPSRFFFYEMIDDIVGNHPKNSCTHSLNSLDTPIVADGENEDPDLEMERNDQNSTEIEKQLEEDPPSKEKSCGQNNFSPSKKRKRISEKQLKKEYVDLKREEFTKRQKRHEEKILIEKERNEIDKKKLSVLEEYLQNKTRH